MNQISKIKFGDAPTLFQQLCESNHDGIVVITDITISNLKHYHNTVLEHPNLLTSITLQAGETTKTWKTIEEIIAKLEIINASRLTAIVAIGGGVIGDIAGFAASIYRRGTSFFNFPTTLLAQVDAAIGGKNGINTIAGKNSLGTFYFPKEINIDIKFLDTLSSRDFYAGFAEIIKYGLIADAEFFNWLEKNSKELISKNTDKLTEAIKRSCEIKTQIVSQDHDEQKNIRQLLNFGHTIAHALEAATCYEKFLHGEAVAIGMVQAAKLSNKRGFISKEDLERITKLLETFKLPISLPEIPQQQLLQFMKHDKKNERQKIKIVILKKLGEAELIDEDNTVLLPKIPIPDYNSKLK